MDMLLFCGFILITFTGISALILAALAENKENTNDKSNYNSDDPDHL